MRRLRLLNEDPRQVAIPGAGNFGTTIQQHGELESLSPTRRDSATSAGLGQVCSPRADGGPQCAPPM